MFRHAYAHMMLAAGMQETDLMAVVGLAEPGDGRPLRRIDAGRAGDRGGARAQPGRSSGQRPIVPPRQGPIRDPRRGLERSDAAWREFEGDAGSPALGRFDAARSSALDLASRNM